MEGLKVTEKETAKIVANPSEKALRLFRTFFEKGVHRGNIEDFTLMVL